MILNEKNNVYSIHTKLNSFHAEMSLAETDEYFEKVRGNSEIREVPIGSYDIPFGTSYFHFALAAKILKCE